MPDLLVVRLTRLVEDTEGPGHSIHGGVGLVTPLTVEDHLTPPKGGGVDPGRQDETED